MGDIYFLCYVTVSIETQFTKWHPAFIFYSMPVIIIFVTTNSSIPYLLPSLPNPPCLTPPNGAAGSLIEPKVYLGKHAKKHAVRTGIDLPTLTPTMPTCSATATRQQRLELLLQKYRPDQHQSHWPYLWPLFRSRMERKQRQDQRFTRCKSSCPASCQPEL